MIIEKIRAELPRFSTRSAWDKGVNEYAAELLESLAERIQYEGREPETCLELRAWLFNGASDWSQYSWGSCSLVYDSDIAERLCTPSELKRTRNGERQPNAREEWLDTQARALYQAARRIEISFRNVMGAENE